MVAVSLKKKKKKKNSPQNTTKTKSEKQKLQQPKKQFDTTNTDLIEYDDEKLIPQNVPLPGA